MTEKGSILKVDSEFRRLVYPYSQEEHEIMEQEILQRGCREPVTVWYGYIIWGFEQYEICMMHGIPYEMKNISFRVREEAVSIICRKELSSRRLPENQRRYLIGKRYIADSIVESHNASGTDQFREHSRKDLFKGRKFYEISAGRTKERLAGEYQLNERSIIRYSVFAQAVDYIVSIKPEMIDPILAGKLKITMETVIACYGKPEEEVTKLLSPGKGSLRLKKSVCANNEMISDFSIKDMPAFDPDAEINSLALTVPSWISSIDRTRSTAKYSLLSEKGKIRLEQELCQLQEAIQGMLYALKEVR